MWILSPHSIKQYSIITFVSTSGQFCLSEIKGFYPLELVVFCPICTIRFARCRVRKTVTAVASFRCPTYGIIHTVAYLHKYHNIAMKIVLRGVYFAFIWKTHCLVEPATVGNYPAWKPYPTYWYRVHKIYDHVLRHIWVRQCIDLKLMIFVCK